MDHSSVCPYANDSETSNLEQYVHYIDRTCSRIVKN
jgi:hypothetical protein